MKLKPESAQLIAITGGSSGIGLATAKMAARKGARVLIAARSRVALAQAVDEIRQTGGEAGIRRGGRRRPGCGREDRCRGRVALWRLRQLDQRCRRDRLGEGRRRDRAGHAPLVRDQFLGGRPRIGSRDRAHLRDKSGALVNIGSVESDRAFPLQGIYAASKHAVKGFTDALRMELEADEAPMRAAEPGTSRRGGSAGS